jgi:glc operon protein GlcG
MKGLAAVSVAAAVLLLTGAVQGADQGASPPNPLDTIPPKLPFNTPYGAPITLPRAQALLQAALNEANRRGWPLNVAVVDSGANLVAFVRMDGAQLASIDISQHKARAAVKYRRPTRFYEDAIQVQHNDYVFSLDDMITSRGGIPLIENGKLIGAIGCSGGSGSQDEAVCTVAADTINKATP